MPTRRTQHRPVPLVALLLAWLVPGAGHAYVGRVRRGIVLFLTISGLFWAGLAMGGVMTVDYQSERWWFVAEMFSGVHGLIGWHRAQKVQDSVAVDPEQAMHVPPGLDPGLYHQILTDAAMKEKGLVLVAPVDTVARAYAGVAGLLNLLCIFDATMLALTGLTGERPPGPSPRPTARPEAS